MARSRSTTSQMRPLEKVAALAGGAVVFTVVGYWTRRALERVFGKHDEPERVVVVVRGGQEVEVLPNGHTIVLDEDGEEQEVSS